MFSLRFQLNIYTENLQMSIGNKMLKLAQKYTAIL